MFYVQSFLKLFSGVDLGRAGPTFIAQLVGHRIIANCIRFRFYLYLLCTISYSNRKALENAKILEQNCFSQKTIALTFQTNTSNIVLLKILIFL